MKQITFLVTSRKVKICTDMPRQGCRKTQQSHSNQNLGATKEHSSTD